MGPQRDCSALATAFIDFEESHGLWDARAQGVSYWHEVRNDVWNATLEALGLAGAAHKRLAELPLTQVLPRQLADIPPLVSRALGRSLSRADLLVLNHPRHVLDGSRYICPYSQPLLDGLPHTRVLLEGHFQGRYFLPSAAENIAYIDPALVLAHARFRATHLRGAGLSSGELADIATWSEQLAAELGATPTQATLVRRVRTAVLATLGLRDYYEHLLDRVQPKVIVNVIGYRLVNMVLTRIARARGIPVVELQHGMLGPTHIAYNFRPGRVPPAFPDQLLLFGSFYRDVTPRLPLPAERMPAIGFAWLEAQRARARAARADHAASTVLFISQGSIGRELSQVALALRAETPELRVIYRLHPSEAPAWERTYGELTRAGITVELPAQRPLYASLSAADVQVGVYSTTLVEGLAFGLRTFVMALPGHEELAALTNAGHATLVADARQLAARLRDDPRELQGRAVDTLWQASPVARFREVIDGLLG